MKREVICIDITNIIPGKGGTGGGITTYAINLVKNLDVILDDNSPRVYCIKNIEFTNLGGLQRIILIDKKVNNSNLISRLFWLNIRLPWFCLTKKVRVLHRIVPELPVVKVCRYIITMHDFMFDFYLKKPALKKYLSKGNLLKFRLFQFFGTLAIKSSDGIIVPAETIKHELENKFPEQNRKVISIYEASEYSNSGQSSCNSKLLTIGVVAGFYPHKGHFYVLKLARHFLDLGFKDFRILMRGSEIYPDYVSGIKHAIIQHGLQNFIEFEPFVKKITLKEIYSKYDLVVLLSEYEGFGLPILEAQSHSIPVLCSSIPIFKEILRESAFYLDPDPDVHEISKILNLIRNEKIRSEMILRGNQNLQRFSWLQMAKQSLMFYKNFLK